MEDFNSKYSGEQVEALLDQVASGNAGGGGGGGIAVETDPIFSASPAATITEADKSAWSGKQDAISDLATIRSGAAKGATAVQPKDVLDIVNEEGFVTAEDLAGVATSGSYNDLHDKPTIPSAINIAGTNYTPGDSGIIDLNTAYLYRKPSGGIPQSDLSGEVQGALRDAIAYKGTVTQIRMNGSSFSPNGGEIDLGNIPTSIPTEVYIADFTMDSLRTGMNSGTDVDCNLQALVDAMNANKVILVREDEDSAYKGVFVLNGYAEDLIYFSIVDTSGNILWCDGTDYNNLQGIIDVNSLHMRSWDDKQDTLVSGENIKTINGESILGSGDISIEGGSGEAGPQGPQGEQGPKGEDGEDGVGIASVEQTTTSSSDGGSNVVTVTLTNGTKSTFTVKNGSKGSQGEKGDTGETGPQGPQGPQGEQGIQGVQGIQGTKGDTGATGAKGDKGDKGDTGAAGANGTNGVSVSSVKQTTTSTADGGTNVVTVTLSNGTTSTFNVKNGSKGSNGTNGTNGKDGQDGEDGATFTPSVDSAGNLSWTNNKGLANPPTVNIKGPKGDKGDAGETGPQGIQGEQGPKGEDGEDGVGIASVEQTTTSSSDGGSNVVTVTLTDGTTSTFIVKNGSKGSQGDKGETGPQGPQGPQGEQGIQGVQGIQGPKGDTGATGADGAKGDKGDKGDTGAAGANGTNGVSVSSVKQTTTSTADGGNNVVTVTLSNGTTSTFNVKNGSKGSNGTNGTNGKDGQDGEDGATFTPSVDSAGNLSWTNNKGLTNPPTVNIKGPKGDAGSGGGGSSSGSGKEYIVVEPKLSPDGGEAYIGNIMPNTTYIVSIDIATLYIDEFSVSNAPSDEYNVIFSADMGGTTLIINSYDGIYWANGVIPSIEADGVYELSIQRVNLGGSNYFNAVLTPFRYV